jgi:hypothetical protein
MRSILKNYKHPIVTNALYLIVLLVILPVLFVSIARAKEIENTSDASSIMAAPVGFNFTVLNDSETEVQPAIAYSPVRQQYLVVWYNDRPGNDDIRAQRIDTNGKPVGGPFYISAGAGDERSNPDVAYNSKIDQYMVVWENTNQGTGLTSIHCNIVQSNGTLIFANDVILVLESGLATMSHPAVAYASTSDRFLLVWQETFHPAPLQHDIMGRSFWTTLYPDGNAQVISNDTGNGDYRQNPDVAYNRSRNEYLVAWQQRDHTNNEYNVYARRVQGNGTPMQPASVEVDVDPKNQLNPAVAAIPGEPNKGQYLVVYEDHTNAGDTDIWARRVKGEGVVDGGMFPITQSTEDQLNPTVAGLVSGNTYLVAWSQASLPPLAITSIHGQEIAITGDRVGADLPLGGLVADHPAAAGGRDFVVVFDDPALTGNRGIYGQLVGNRVYLPLVTR